MAEYIANIGDQELHVEYIYIPAQAEKYPDTEPLRSYVEIHSIYVYYGDYKCDLTDIMNECADDWLINLESEIIEKLEG